MLDYFGNHIILLMIIIVIINLILYFTYALIIYLHCNKFIKETEKIKIGMNIDYVLMLLNYSAVKNSNDYLIYIFEKKIFSVFTPRYAHYFFVVMDKTTRKIVQCELKKNSLRLDLKKI